MYEDRLKTFTRLYDDLSNIYGSVNVFMDFVKMCAISIYNQFAKNQEMEQEYMRKSTKIYFQGCLENLL